MAVLTDAELAELRRTDPRAWVYATALRSAADAPPLSDAIRARLRQVIVANRLTVTTQERAA